MQDSVLPQGVGLRKPHIFSTIPHSIHPSFLPSLSLLLPPLFSLLTSHFSLLSPFSSILTSLSWARRGAGVEWG